MGKGSIKLSESEPRQKQRLKLRHKQSESKPRQKKRRKVNVFHQILSQNVERLSKCPAKKAY